MPDPIAVDAAGAGELLGMSERLVRELTAEGVLPTIELGKGHSARRYSVEALRRWAVEASGYTRDEEERDGEEAGGRREASQAKGRAVAARRPDRSRKPRAKSAPLPLRVVER